MHVLHDLIAYGQRGRSVPCRYLSLPKSKLWNPKTPLWRPGEELYAIPPRNQRCLRTSSPDRFARAAPGFRCVFSLPHERGHNVCSRRVPADYFVLLITKRVVTNQEPTILSVLTQCSLLNLKRESARQSKPTKVAKSLQIVWMEDSF